jgi:rhodanese-related sulfurtransferase
MKAITCEQYTALRAEGADFVMLDVRNQDEYDAGHMDDAILIPLHILPLRYRDVLPDKDQLIICCCAHGGRASQACAFLTKEGYADVRVLDGGYEGYCALSS